ncbi:hypothetical protein R1sor_025499 [Riccia sorocarpa]|uniref:Plant heme peroxidase family profile domain-containing protein n=1 Tax=Riccia sorocarpa TaxID=122646 RepID=A0ABD3GCG2_9MARC
MPIQVVRCLIEPGSRKSQKAAAVRAGLVIFEAQEVSKDAEMDTCSLLNSTSTNSAEREAHVNFGLRGLKEVDEIKAALEYACPGVVSCADLLILAARDATSIAGGLSWSVGLGRRDSRVSNDLLADGNLPFPVFPFDILVDNFARKNFSAREMVVLSDFTQVMAVYGSLSWDIRSAHKVV